MGALSGSVTTSSSNFNVDAFVAGITDWIKYLDTGSAVRKSGGGSTIEFANPLSAPSMYPSYARTISWVNGTPTASGSDNIGLYADSGWEFDFPADPTERTAYLFCGGFQTLIDLTAHLSDSSAADVVDLGVGDSGGNYVRNYALTYSANSAGQTLNVSFPRSAGGGNVAIFAAAVVVSGGPPAGGDQPAMRRWGGVPHMGGFNGCGGVRGGGAWATRASGVWVPNHLREAA